MSSHGACVLIEQPPSSREVLQPADLMHLEAAALISKGERQIAAGFSRFLQPCLPLPRRSKGPRVQGAQKVVEDLLVEVNFTKVTGPNEAFLENLDQQRGERLGAGQGAVASEAQEVNVLVSI